VVEKETISKFMLQEHGKILVLLNEFKTKSNDKNANEYFQKLKWKQDNHILAEEKAILILMQDNEKMKKVILEILIEHNQLREIMDKIKEKLNRNTDHYEENINALLKLMKAHIQFEDINFYPRLDKELLPKEKALIMSKFQEIILGHISI